MSNVQFLERGRNGIDSKTEFDDVHTRIRNEVSVVIK